MDGGKVCIRRQSGLRDGEGTVSSAWHAVVVEGRVVLAYILDVVVVWSFSLGFGQYCNGIGCLLGN